MQARRKKRQREKRRGKGIDGESESAEIEVDDDAETAVSLTDLFTPYLVVRADGKIRSFCFPDVRSVRGEVQVSIVLSRRLLYVHVIFVAALAQLFIALTSNALQVFEIPSPKTSKLGNMPVEATQTSLLDLPGHRTDIRTLSLSSDDKILASASDGM